MLKGTEFRPEEDEMILRYRKAGFTFVTIAYKLNRPKSSVSHRYTALVKKGRKTNGKTVP